jgi:hypothetical protein
VDTQETITHPGQEKEHQEREILQCLHFCPLPFDLDDDHYYYLITVIIIWGVG